MAILSFKVQADIQKVQDLRNEIIKLEAAMKQMKGKMPTADVSELESKLASAKTELVSVTSEAAKAGASFGTGLKKKISESNTVVNNFTERIIEQRAVIKGIEVDVKRLGDAYAKAVKNSSPNTNSILSDYNAAKKALEEEKAALFGLNQEKAKAQLETKKLKQEYAEYKEQAGGAAKETDDFAASLSKWAKGIIGVKALKEFVGQVVRVRGEFQEMETAISTLVGDNMASKLMPQIRELVKVSPLTMTDIVGAEKMMLGFNIEASKTVDYLKALSDVSMGNSQKFQSLTLAFSQMSAAGKLMGQDLNQMINAGFNPLQVISEKTGKSIAQLKKEMSAGAISAQMVQQAFLDATSEGGKFFNMSQNAAKTINGQISMLEDAVDSMFNSLGKSSEGFIMKSIQGVTALVENYETIGAILISLISTYGTYRAAMIANIALTKGWTAAASADTIAKGIQTVATKALTAAQIALNTAMKANPFVLAATAVVGLGTAIWALSDKTTNAEKAQKKFNEAQEEFQTTQEKNRIAAQSLIDSIRSETASIDDKKKAYEKLLTIAPHLAEKWKLEEIAVWGLVDAEKALNEQDKINIEQSYQKRIADSKAKIADIEKSFGGRRNLASFKRQQEVEEERAVLAKLEKEYEDWKNSLQTEENGPEIRNKEFWEKKKKEAESRLEALDVSKKGSEKWNKYVKEIADAQKEIDKYSTTKTAKTEKEDNQQKAKRAENLRKIQEYKDEVKEANNKAQLEIRQAEINAMEDSTQKTIAQINLDYNKKLIANEKRKKEYIAAIAKQKELEWENENPEKVKKGEKFDKSKVTEASLTPQQKAILAYYDQLAAKEKELAEANAYKGLLGNYQTYMQKHLEIEKKFERDRAAMKKEDGTYKKGFSKENEDILNRDKKAALDEAALFFAEKDTQFQTWANSIADMSLKKLQELLAQARKELVIMEQENAVAESMGLKPKHSSEQIAQQAAKVAKAEEAVKSQSAKNVERDWKDLFRTLKDVEGQFKEIGDAIGGTVGKIIGAAGEIAGSTLSMIDGIRALTDGSIDAIKGASVAATKALQTVERASVILSIVGAALKIMTKISELAKGSGYEKMKSEYENLISAWDKLIDRKLEYLNISYGNEAKKVEEQTLEIIQKQIDAYKELAEEKMKTTRKGGSLGYKMMMTNRLSSDAQQQVVDAGYGDLLGANKGKKLLELTGEQLKDLRDNAYIFWSELDDDIRKYLEGIIDGYDKIAEVQKQLNEQLTATSFDSLYDNFIDSLMDMEASAEDFADNLSEMLTKAMLSDVIGSKYKDKLQKWYNSWAASMEEGVSEQELASLRNEYEDIIKDAIEERNAIAELTGYGSLSTSEQKATYGGFESMSEDTGSELNGRFTALQMAGEEIKRETVAQTVLLNDIKGSLTEYLAVNGGVVKTSLDNMLTFVSQSYMELQQINENTAANVKELKDVSSYIRKWDTKIMGL